ncbi:hypothetical protein BGX27_010028 [Mortierella sp. AM989]|nr:hypothetical protein BGX27_010028 [Mortierella sp. AM989]
MSHLIDPCLRATKIAHGIRRGIDGISPLSGLVPELRILIQEQKNVLSSLKRAAFEKEEAAKHLAIYAKTEGPDIADTLTKLSILIQKAADLERDYANSLAQSREIFKEIRVAEDENYSVRKRKIDLEQKLSLERTSHHPSTTSLASTSTVGKAGSVYGAEIHPEMQLLRKETMTVENELEDLKRKKIKTATTQQLNALEKLGKELIVIAHYGQHIMGHLDDSLTPAGTHADDRFAAYDGEAKTAYSVKACLDTFQTWPKHEPQIQFVEIDLGDFPRDNKQAMDVILKDQATKSGSDWYSLQSPTSKTPLSHGRTSSISSASSASPRQSISSIVTTTTYVDGVPTVKVINEIPPTPELENGPVKGLGDANGVASATAVAAQEPIPIFVADTTTTGSVGEDSRSAVQEINDSRNPKAGGENNAVPALTTTGVGSPSPFIPQITYRPATTYQASHSSEGRISPQSKSRPLSGENHVAIGHAPHPLMMQHAPQPHRQQMYPPGPPGGDYSTPISMPMPQDPMSGPLALHMPMPVPMPHIPGSPDDENRSNKRHSQPISVSFPMRPSPSTSPSPGALDQGGVTSATMSSSSSRPQHHPQRRNPHAVLPPTEPGFRVPLETESTNVYDGPPPDYAEASMQPPAEKREEKNRR